MSDECWAARDELSAKKDALGNAKSKLSDLRWKKGDLDSNLQSASNAVGSKTAEADRARWEAEQATAKAVHLMREYEVARDAWQAAVAERPRDMDRVTKLKSTQDRLYADEEAASEAQTKAQGRKRRAEEAEAAAKAEHERVAKLVATMKTTIENQEKKVKDATEVAKKAERRVNEVCD